MTLWQGSKAQLLTAAAAAIGIPFYLGFVHTPVPQLVLYSGVAGAAMATGDYVESPQIRSYGVRLFVADAAVWATAIAVFGAAAYAIALIF